MEETMKYFHILIPEVMTPIESISILMNHGPSVREIVEHKLGIGAVDSCIWCQLNECGQIVD